MMFVFFFWAKSLLYNVICHTKSLLNSFSFPSEQFTANHTDSVGPLPLCFLKRHFFFIPSVIPFNLHWQDGTKHLLFILFFDVAANPSVFLSVWISRFGVPLCERQITAANLNKIYSTNLTLITGFHRQMAIGYNPQEQDMEERFHKTSNVPIPKFLSTVLSMSMPMPILVRL